MGSGYSPINTRKNQHKYKNIAEEYYYLAQSYFKLGDINEAISHCKEAIELENYNIDYRLLLVELYVEVVIDASICRQPFIAGKIKKQIRKIIDIDPNNLEGRTRLMKYYQYAPRILGGNFDKAIGQAQIIVKLDEKEGYESFFKIYYDKDMFVEAESQLKILEERFDNEKEFYFFYNKYGYFLLKQGMVDEAIRKFKKQVELAPDEGNEGLPIFKYKTDSMWLTELKDAGITLLLGTDAGPADKGLVPGFSIHDELRILTENGLTPYEAIATGTINASKIIMAITGKDDFGTIEVGKRADLILVNKNPLENVANIKDYQGVMVSSKWYSKKALEQMIRQDFRNQIIPASRELLKIIKKKGVTAAVERYWEEKKEVSKDKRIDISEDEINRLGYELMKTGRIEEAIVIFKLNVTEHPDSWNVYDSFGEACMKNGNQYLAIENYKKSLELNAPNNANILPIDQQRITHPELGSIPAIIPDVIKIPDPIIFAITMPVAVFKPIVLFTHFLCLCP
ncbi:hypothetical protein ES705_35327 [subsurface metagenome]